MVLGQKWCGTIVKRDAGTNDLAETGNARLEEILHVVRHRGGSDSSKQLYRRNEMTATQVHNTSDIDPLLGFDVQAQYLPPHDMLDFSPAILKSST